MLLFSTAFLLFFAALGLAASPLSQPTTQRSTTTIKRHLLKLLTQAQRRYRAPLDIAERRRFQQLAVIFEHTRPTSNEVLREALQHPRWTLREAALQTLLSMPSASVRAMHPQITPLLLDRYAQIRHLAHHLLKTHIDPHTKRPLLPHPWDILLLLASFLMALGGALLLSRIWSKKRIYRALWALFSGVALGLLPLYLLARLMKMPLDPFQPAEAFDELGRILFYLQLLWWGCALALAMYRLRLNEAQQGYPPHLASDLCGLGGMALFLLTVALLQMTFAGYRLPFPPLFAALFFFTAALSWLLGYALSSTRFLHR